MTANSAPRASPSTGSRPAVPEAREQRGHGSRPRAATTVGPARPRASGRERRPARRWHASSSIGLRAAHRARPERRRAPRRARPPAGAAGGDRRRLGGSGSGSGPRRGREALPAPRGVGGQERAARARRSGRPRAQRTPGRSPDREVSAAASRSQAASCSALRDQVCSRSAHARPALPIAPARPGPRAASRHGVGDLRHVRPVDQEPGLAVDQRLPRPPRVADHHGPPAAAASTNTMPQPSTSSPPRRLRHGIANTSPTA